ncbi:30S ribosomal protein S6 [Desulfuromonas thiophila]|uniref:Small ribosomal subunit protein bS6 n=1 Tax=Desulfuromonas thiophila TaxID=57664 RepID=A0A1G6YYR5_9BACT|nr:30S ribosomal protein S6 [Desulfuromonas thiophila]SDD94775.1 SSU ribosomal protein S6P [Desulfuromonas thiophila]
MRTYETIFIVDPRVAGDDYSTLLEKYKGVLAAESAELLKCAEWGTKRLAYPVKKHEQGTYVLMNYKAGNAVVKEFERRMRIDDAVIKFQTVVLDGELDLSAPTAVVADEDAVADDDDEEDAE